MAVSPSVTSTSLAGLLVPNRPSGSAVSSVTDSSTSSSSVYDPYVTIPGVGIVLPHLNVQECFQGASWHCPTWVIPTRTVNLTGTALSSYEASISYGRSPQCSSAFSASIRAPASITTLVKSGMATLTSIVAPSPHPSNPCCGRCRFFWPSADVYFFPQPEANLDTSGIENARASFSTRYFGQKTNSQGSKPLDPPTTSILSVGVFRTGSNGTEGSSRSSMTITSQTSSSLHSLRHRAHSLISTGPPGYAVGSDGFTYTSPSIYVTFHTVYATDSCGVRGVPRTSLTLAFAPGELSTMVGPVGFPPVSEVPLNVADLPCPRTDIWGDGCRPRLVLPKKLLDLDPGWAGCETSDLYEGVDPPRALTPVVAMDPATTNLDPAATPTPPAPNSAPQLPTNTIHATTVSSDPANDPAVIQPAATVIPSPQTISRSASKVAQGSIPDDPQPSLKDPLAPAFSSSRRENAPEVTSVSNDGDPPSWRLSVLQSGAVPGQTHIATHGPLSPTIVDLPAVVAHSHTRSGNEPAVTLDRSMVLLSSGSTYVSSSAISAFISSPTQQQQQVTILAVVGSLRILPVQQDSRQGSQYTPAVILQGQTIFQNGPIVTVEGYAVAYSGGSVLVGTNAVPVPTTPQQDHETGIIEGLTYSVVHSSAQVTALSTPSISVAVVAGISVTAGTTGIEVNGEQLIPGAAPLTFEGKPVSLGPSGVVVGSGTAAITLPVGFSASPLATIAGQTIAAGPLGGAIIGTTTMALGRPPINVSGTAVSVGSYGLVIGSSTIVLSTTPHSSILTVAGQTFTANPTAVAIAGTTLSPGGAAVTLSGTPISLGPSGSLVVGSTTIPLANPSESNGGWLGGAIMFGLGPIEPTATTTAGNSTISVFMGGAQTRMGMSRLAMLLLAMVACLAWVRA